MNEEARVFVVLCKMCDFRCFDNAALINHARDVHENDPNFILYCGECGRSYNKWNSLKKHLHRENSDDRRKEVVCMSHISITVIFYNFLIGKTFSQNNKEG